jgi:hypothetical protein
VRNCRRGTGQFRAQEGPPLRSALGPLSSFFPFSVLTLQTHMPRARLERYIKKLLDLIPAWQGRELRRLASKPESPEVCSNTPRRRRRAFPLVPEHVGALSKMLIEGSVPILLCAAFGARKLG